MSILPEIRKDPHPSAQKEAAPTPVEKLKVTTLLGKILLNNGREIVVGVTPDGSLAVADSAADFDLSGAETLATMGDMGLGKEIELAQYDIVIPVYIDQSQAEIVRVTELQHTESYIKIVATIPAGTVATQTFSALAGTTIELTYSVEQFLEHFRSAKQPFFSLRSSRQTAVSTFLVLDVPEGALNLPRDQKAGIAICFQWKRNELQQVVGDHGIPSVSILAEFIRDLIDRIDYESYDTYKPLIDAIKMLFAITSREVSWLKQMQMSLSWEVSSSELKTLQKIRARIHDARHPHPFLLPQLLITAIAHFGNLKSESPLELIKNVVDWLVTDPTGLLEEPETKKKSTAPKQSVAKKESVFTLVETPYTSNTKQFRGCAEIDKQWLRVKSKDDYYSRQESRYQELHNAQDVSGWCEDLCSLLKPEIQLDLHVRFHILHKLYQYIQNGTLLNSNVSLLGKQDKTIEMTLAHQLHTRATQILHSMSSQDFETLQSSGFLDTKFRESGALYFMCHMYTYTSAEDCSKFMERWVSAHLARLENFSPPFNSRVVNAVKELMNQADNFLENADASATAASKQHCRMLIHWTKSIVNTGNATYYPKFISPTTSGRVETIDQALFSVVKWKPYADTVLEVTAFEPTTQHYEAWANAIVSAYLSNTSAMSLGNLLQKLQDLFKYVVDEKKMLHIQVVGTNLSLGEFLKNKIELLRCSHLAPTDVTTQTVEQWCERLLKAVRHDSKQFSLLPENCLQLFAERTEFMFAMYLLDQPPHTTHSEAASLSELLSYVDNVINYYNDVTGKPLRPGSGVGHYIEKLRKISRNSSKIRTAISVGSKLQPKKK